MTVGIHIIATGRYTLFFDKLYKSIQQHFLTNHTKQFYVFTDKPQDFVSYENCFVTKIERLGFPGDTLFRFNYMLKVKEHAETHTEYNYYMDVDSLVINSVDETIFSDIVLVSHPGFYKLNLGTPETNPNSVAYIAPNEPREHYVAGGFFGGRTKQFFQMADEINKMIYKDYNNGIIPIHNDESMLNRWYTDNQRDIKVLTPEYVYPECKYKFPRMNNFIKVVGLTPRILALDKNHHWYRSEN